ncbi:TlpA family protein disulfide reductase [Ancylobacter sp. A5.8]|uniref:TlpA disulfide reductase family protein n=1 Tax=Ancylobacter gelatini TaxID=2919920 RepID=UPI001F4D98A2|nr:TlpA disulfide reductase family protein [Ancylobacter gelatini]MCJ8143344.1 TlpA family protein disulfide reductase [Ancylobacter gelatini]
MAFLSVLALFAPGRGAVAAEPARLEPGADVPPIDLPSLHHGPQSLAALQGQVVLVHFFATWCEPCREEMAGLSRLSERFSKRPSAPAVAILAVDVGEVEIRVRRFFEKQPVPFPVLLDAERAAMKAWQVGVFPTTFLLDATHRLRLVADIPIDWDRPEAEAILDILQADEAESAAALPALPALQTDNGSTQ